MAKKQTRRQKEQAQAAENINLIVDSAINADDKLLMADQCYHNNMATQIGTYSSTLSKYAVYYSNRWFFVAYKRDENKVTSILEMNMLNHDEIIKFTYYKNRLENEKRAQRERNFKEENNTQE